MITGAATRPGPGSADGRQLEPGHGVQPRDHRGHDLAEGFGLRRSRLTHRDGDTGVAALARLHLERDLAQERHAEFVGDALTPSFTEDLVSLAGVWRDEEAHIQIGRASCRERV